MEKSNYTCRKVLVAAGSNLKSAYGNALETVALGLDQLAGEGLDSVARSRMFRTPAFPAGSGPDFVNAAACFETTLSPQEVLAALHRVEKRLGRTRDTRWEARILDLDWLAYDDLILPDRETYQTWATLPPAEQMAQAPDRLILPHPRLSERAFVLVPLLDVAADWVHPVSGLTIREMVATLPAADVAAVVALPDKGEAS